MKNKVTTQTQPVLDIHQQSFEINGEMFTEVTTKEVVSIDEKLSVRRAEKNSFLRLPVLNKLLEHFQVIDFNALIEDDCKLQTKHYLYIVVDEVVRKAKECGFEICLSQGSCYIYNGTHFQPLETPEIMNLLTSAAVKMGMRKHEAGYFAFQQQLIKQFFSAVPIKTRSSRKDKVLINLLNGTFEITTNKQFLRQHTSDDFITYQLPFVYDKDADATEFQKYLDRVLPEKESQYILAEYLGYCLTDLKLEKTLILIGSGSNGKSVFFEIVNALFGSDNVSNYSLQGLTKKDGYERAMLANKLINYASEISTQLNSTIFKQLTSGEPLEARQIYHRPFILNNYAKLICNCNELFREAENTHAFYRRLLVVPFNVTIPEDEQDAELANRIISNELSGVFSWVIQGLCRLLVQKKFTHSDVVDKMIEQYKSETDTITMFLEEKNYVSNGTECIYLKDFYIKYRKLCSEFGYPPLNKGLFVKGLKSKNFIIERKNCGNMVYAYNAFWRQ